MPLSPPTLYLAVAWHHAPHPPHTHLAVAWHHAAPPPPTHLAVARHHAPPVPSSSMASSLDVQLSALPHLGTDIWLPVSSLNCVMGSVQPCKQPRGGGGAGSGEGRGHAAGSHSRGGGGGGARSSHQQSQHMPSISHALTSTATYFSCPHFHCYSLTVNQQHIQLTADEQHAPLTLGHRGA